MKKNLRYFLAIILVVSLVAFIMASSDDDDSSLDFICGNSLLFYFWILPLLGLFYSPHNLLPPKLLISFLAGKEKSPPNFRFR